MVRSYTLYKQISKEGEGASKYQGYTDAPTTDLKDHRLVSLVVKASASRAEDPEFESCLLQDFFRGRVIPVT